MKNSSIYLFGAMVSWFGFGFMAIMHMQTSAQIFLVLGLTFAATTVGMFGLSLSRLLKND